MRLQAIKLAGFKSFVDPTTVPFPSNLCALVGPNGCGKSNIIDAVRWVMGESSARMLRGESMTDVIFNGSATRKPVGKAGIELLFDNTAGHLTGEYATYSEISVKRQVTRDGQSNYFLNNQPCRRKDITDLFLDTGLGPRSYTIIEQGMVSELVEAKPRELRSYLEEVAGIAKYKERRRETERRISHTRDNLGRLEDLRRELERQLAHLERQARTAERYTALKKKERKLEAELSALRWRTLSSEIKAADEEITRLQLQREEREAARRQIDAALETRRAQLLDLSDRLDEVQQRYYGHGTEIARIEESLQSRSERNTRLDAEMAEIRENSRVVQADIRADEAELSRLQREISDLGPEQDEIRALEQASSAELMVAEEAMQAWQLSWDEFNQQVAERRQQAEVEQSRIGHLEESIKRAATKVAALEGDIEKLTEDPSADQLGPLREMLETQETRISGIQDRLGDLDRRVDLQRTENKRLSGQLDESRRKLQSLKGRYASLEALQQAALGQRDDAPVQWLESHGLGRHRRLAEKIQVAEGWDLAAETVLGSRLQAVCVDELDAVAALLEDFNQGHLDFTTNRDQAAAGLDKTLAGKISGDVALGPLVKSVYLAENLSEAMTARRSLADGESVVTRDGVWLGPDWLRVNKDRDAEGGIIGRQKELASLAGEISAEEVAVQNLGAALDDGMQALRQAESERELAGTDLSKQQRSFAEARSQLGARQVQAQQREADIKRTIEEIRDFLAQQERDNASLQQAREQLQLARDGMAADAQKRAEMTQERDRMNTELARARTKAKTDADRGHRLALKSQDIRSRISFALQAIDRLRQQEGTLKSRKETLEKAIRENLEPLGELKAALQSHLEKRLSVEKELTEVRTRSEQLGQTTRQMEQERGRLDDAMEQVRASMEQTRLNKQGLETRRAMVGEQLEQDKQDLQLLLDGLSAETGEADREQKLAALGSRLQRLGAINLTAIDEYHSQSKRKQYLDAQNEDLEKALDTLGDAIRKIDVETRTKFKETFDQVCDSFQQIFPKLFSGGHAYLEMTGDDLSSTGVSIMARPPGKRNVGIHLLSGGEKALTAIALVFSIFNLKPAPFCLLDEVDAALDDANCIRYVEMLKEMSRTVQFIFVTHNKIAMEMGDHLLGVTMQEPGVSGLVAVDVDEAVAMAAV